MLWVGCIAVLLFLLGLPWRMDVTYRTVKSEKLKRKTRLCVLADVHCRRFPKIRKIVDEAKPDLVIIPGDLFDTGRDFSISFDLIDSLKGYPVFFTSGNHDVYLPEINELRRKLRQKGVHVLENTGMETGDLEITGMSDQGDMPSFAGGQMQKWIHTDKYHILISHRPHYMPFYAETPFDLVISGHAHGGQWRLPFTHCGIIAPQQGFFPRYTEGLHVLGKQRYLFISRGLASGAPWFFRFCSNPEVCFLDLEPDL